VIFRSARYGIRKRSASRLTYWSVFWKTLGRLCGKAGLGDEARKLFDEIAQIQTVDVVMPTKSGVEIRRRCVARPTKHQAILLQYLGMRLPLHLKVSEM